MDTFENNNSNLTNNTENTQPTPEEPTPAQPEEPSPSFYSCAGTRRRGSPYANSPYVTNQNNSEYRYQPQTQPPQHKPAKEKKSRKPIWKGVVAVVLVVALVAGGCLITAAAVNSRWEDRTEDTVAELNRKIDDLQEQIDKGSASGGSAVHNSMDGSAMSPSQVYSQNVSSVVAITSTVQATNFYGTSTGTSTGSGFILTEDGYIVSNYHVVEGATEIKITLHDGSEYPAELVGYDSTNDLSVLKIDAEGLTAATIGSSSGLNIGDMVVAIGNPLGTLTSTQTVGYVSGINREVTTDNTIISMIQTDCAINPGNSGGPLFNMYGEVVGITTAKYSGTTSSGATIEGIGFAIPIDDVMNAISDLIDYGYVTGAYLGVSVKNTDAESASMFGLPTGAYVVSVEKGHSADRAGIQVKDIIIDLGGTKVTNVTELTRALRNFKAGDSTTITVVRSGSQLTLDIVLDEKPQQTTAAATEKDAEMPSNGDYQEWYDYFRKYFGE